ncbi:MAG TPA: capsule assembly Wzi family protein [Candidatus Eisenbacteria bacterium]|nr:capsule assembly Wzi family protein [Candidatus Eisenbacteria bacterium]
MLHLPALFLSSALVVAGTLGFFLHASATPLDDIPVGDVPTGDVLEDEIRVLEISGDSLRLPRRGMLPNQVVDLPALDRPLSRAAEVSRLRLSRAIARDLGVSGSTPRLMQLVYDDERLEASLGVEGRGTVAEGQLAEFASGSGIRLRLAAQLGRWLAYADVIGGHVEDSDRFAERQLNNDMVLLTDKSQISYTGARERWAATVGRSRWHWGPGEEGSLVLSKTSPAFSAVTFRMRIEPLRADGMIINATLKSAAGMQMAAHRLEWQPLDNLRLGVSEAARYQATGWVPLYAVGVIPYSIVQSLLVRDEPESVSTLRNNVIAGVDAAWRVAPGTRIYSELLIDDLNTDETGTVNKYGYQVGLEGVGTVRGTRVRWNTEYTRLSRFVYTSYYDRAFVTAGEPLGFPTGPDSRRMRVRIAWDPTVSWQVFGIAARSDFGESGLDSTYVPGSPPVDVMEFAGVVETQRAVELGLRYWPASGIDVAASAGFTWIRNGGHVESAERREPFASLTLRLTR